MRKEIGVCDYAVRIFCSFPTQRQVFTTFGNEVLTRLAATHLEKQDDDCP